MVSFREQSTRSLGQNCGSDVAGIRRKRTSYFPCNDPLSRGQLKSKGRGKLFVHFTADQNAVDTIYRIILFVNQLSVYGTVAAICEEFEDQDRTGQPVMLVGQSIVLGEKKAVTSVHDGSTFNKLNRFLQKTD